MFVQKLTLADAISIASGTLKAGASLKPLTVVILDAGGRLLFFAKEDGSSLMRRAIATGKAFGALGLGLDSADVGAIAEARPLFAGSLFAIAENGAVPVPGGVLIRSNDGKNTILGAVGVSGDLSVKDEACAIAGIKGANFLCKTASANVSATDVVATARRAREAWPIASKL